MIRVHIIVEGQTEETFVQNVLYYYYLDKGIILNPFCFRTSRNAKGGVSFFGKIKNDVIKKCRQDKNAYVTTMIDYYGRPKDFPGNESLPTADIYQKVRHLEECFGKDINERNFFPNLIVHEFEGLLFSDLNCFDNFIDSSLIDILLEVKKGFDSPEHINESQDTAPSKRILGCFPIYQIVLHGSLVSQRIGIDVMRRECQHFNEWLTWLDSLANDN